MEQMPAWCQSRIINLSPDEQDYGSSMCAVLQFLLWETQLPRATAHGNESGTWSCTGGVTWEQSSGSWPKGVWHFTPKVVQVWDAQPCAWHRDLPAWEWANLLCTEQEVLGRGGDKNRFILARLWKCKSLG